MLWQEAQNPGKGNTCKKSHVVYRTNTYICTCKLGNCYFHFITCLISAISPNKGSSHLSDLKSETREEDKVHWEIQQLFQSVTEVSFNHL